MSPPDSIDQSIITTGELSRAVGLIRGDISKLRDDVASRPSSEDLARVEAQLRREMAQAATAQTLRDELQDKAIAAVEGWQTWALRLGGPAVAAALVAAIASLRPL